MVLICIADKGSSEGSKVGWESTGLRFKRIQAAMFPSLVSSISQPSITIHRFELVLWILASENEGIQRRKPDQVCCSARAGWRSAQSNLPWPQGRTSDSLIAKGTGYTQWTIELGIDCLPLLATCSSISPLQACPPRRQRYATPSRRSVPLPINFCRRFSPPNLFRSPVISVSGTRICAWYRLWTCFWACNVGNELLASFRPRMWFHCLVYPSFAPYRSYGTK